MNDENKSKSSKVKVMYVRGEEATSSRSSGNPRTGKGGRSSDRKAPTDRRSSSSPRRDESSVRRNESSSHRNDSPWRTVSKRPTEQKESTQAPSADEGLTAKSYIDPEQLRRQRQEETRVYGENACQALFQSRPEAIVRAWFVQSVTPRFRETLRWLAANRKAYHVVDDSELAKAAGTEHHGGVCFIIKKQTGLDVAAWLAQAEEQDCVVALENVGNPHNLGAIMRSCAHFGAKAILVNDANLLESGAAVRTAEGGAEHVRAVTAPSFLQGLDAFRRAGYSIVTTSSHEGQPLASTTFPTKTVFVLGQEGEGLHEETLRQGDISLSIGGTGNIESLNVSVAAGILLGEWWRQQKA
ncbi:tRNA/rRNA methyltransferase [Rosenbergiella sp. S61]|uniref:tRNA/rRNA methyltransferase n=1 Tax=Rosenbergiella gaditana TaxID=2726987 RepID=A0ABS5SZ59_9GAMM|nr:tRNA/rRNA methyltransferase [Rosenbergiella gaditana]MBT0725395.1 tRNA/rRNA methyltransferase [Rosenbergiella gaditana]